MDLRGKIRQGMPILGSDDRYYGSVEGYDDVHIYVGGSPVPHSAFERVGDDRLYIGEAGRRYFVEAADDERSEIRVPLAEERLQVSTQPVELGDVRIHKRVDEVEEVVREPLIRGDVVIERVKTRRRVEGPVGPRQEDDWLVVPIVEERLLVQKILVVTEEIRIRQRPVTEVQEIRETLRRERVEVEDRTSRAAGPRATNARDTEPTVHRGGELGGPGGESWEHLWQEIWEEPSSPRAATARAVDRPEQ